MKSDSKFSIIIPTLNEEHNIQRCLNIVKNNFPQSQIILTDGGSRDNTLKYAKEFNVEIVNSQEGRGIQLNNGAEKAEGDLFVFLHADTVLPSKAKDIILNAFKNPEVKIATFSMSFDIDSPVLKFYSMFTKIDSIFTKFGDFCIVVRRDFFYSINKFPDWVLFEDVEFLRKARRLTKIYTLPGKVTTSGRRYYRNGFIKTQVRSAYYIFLYLLGVSPKILNYKYNRMKSINKKAVIIFSKYPRKGEVKTRLAKTLGNDFATLFYKNCAEHTFAETLKLATKNVTPFLFYSNQKDKQKINSWVNKKFTLYSQAGGDLGERMKNAFNSIFSLGIEKVIIIGSDLPDISAKIISDAFDLLDSNDVVIGPAFDGGYYLLGLNKMVTALFEGISWSSSEVLNSTISKLNSLNLTYHLLPKLLDIDTEADIVNWLNSSKTGINRELKPKIESLYLSLTKI